MLPGTDLAVVGGSVVAVEQLVTDLAVVGGSVVAVVLDLAVVVESVAVVVLEFGFFKISH